MFKRKTETPTPPSAALANPADLPDSDPQLNDPKYQDGVKFAELYFDCLTRNPESVSLAGYLDDVESIGKRKAGEFNLMALGLPGMPCRGSLPIWSALLMSAGVPTTVDTFVNDLSELRAVFLAIERLAADEAEHSDIQDLADLGFRLASEAHGRALNDRYLAEKVGQTAIDREANHV